MSWLLRCEKWAENQTGNEDWKCEKLGWYIEQLALGRETSTSDEWEEWQQGMWSILVDKTGGEARSVLLSVDKGERIKAWAKIWRWFTRTSGLGISERRERIMRPEPPKKEQ